MGRQIQRWNESNSRTHCPSPQALMSKTPENTIFESEMGRKLTALTNYVFEGKGIWNSFNSDNLEGGGLYGANATTPEYFTARFTKSIRLLKGSIFNCNLEDNRRFLHFTSLTKGKHILLSKSFRMYELNNMEDKMELTHALNLLDGLPSGFGDHNPIDLKNELFCLSLSDFDQIRNEFLWNEYGDKNQGLCFAISIEPPKNDFDWLGYYLGKVDYKKTEELIEITSLKENYIKFKEELKFEVENIKAVMALLLNFYKNPAPYCEEKEIRLLRHVSKNGSEKHNDAYIKEDPNKPFNDRQLNYSELSFNQEAVGHPKLKIEKILIGKAINGQHLKTTIVELNELTNGTIELDPLS